jgi:hypothetical protein
MSRSAATTSREKRAGDIDAGGPVLAQLRNPSRILSPSQVLLRFFMRLAILLVFAAFGHAGFGKGLAALTAMAAVLCALVAAVRREAPFPRALNHWDEALAFAALYFLAVGAGLSSPL